MGLKKKLVMVLATSTAGVAMVAGGSLALFSANATNSSNTFKAGNVSILDQTGSSIASKVVNFNNLTPGDGGEQYLAIKNDGSLDAWVNVDEAGTKATETGDLFLKDSFILYPQYSPVYVKSGETVNIPVYYKLPLSATVMSVNSGSVDLKVDAVQAKNNNSGLQISNPSLVWDTPGQSIIAYFTVNQDIDLSKSGANVVLSYQTLENGAWTEVYRKDKTWEGYLNDSSGHLSPGIKDLTPDYDASVSANVPGGTPISTEVKDSNGKTWVDNATATNFRVVVTVSDGNGGMDVQTLTLP